MGKDASSAATRSHSARVRGILPADAGEGGPQGAAGPAGGERPGVGAQQALERDVGAVSRAAAAGARAGVLLRAARARGAAGAAAAKKVGYKRNG